MKLIWKAKYFFIIKSQDLENHNNQLIHQFNEWKWLDEKLSNHYKSIPETTIEKHTHNPKNNFENQ